jgi:hypothetical protein
MQKDTSNTRNIAHLFGRSTPEHGRDQKYRTLKGEPWKQESAGQATALPTQQQDQPRSARTVGLELSLCKPRLSLSSPVPIFRLRVRLSRPWTLSLSREKDRALTPWHWHARVEEEEGTEERGECGSATDYDIGRLMSRMLFAVRLLFALSKHHCHEAAMPMESNLSNAVARDHAQSSTEEPHELQYWLDGPIRHSRLWLG